jgi:hypothetical protein
VLSRRSKLLKLVGSKMTKAQAGWRKTVRQACKTPLRLLIPTLICFLLAGSQVGEPPDQFTRLFIFSVVCLVIYHFSFWFWRSYTTEKSLKVVEYLYLAIAFLGIFGVLDVQASIVKMKVPQAVSFTISELEKLDPCVDCKWEQEVLKELRSTPYNHGHMRDLLGIGRSQNQELGQRFLGSNHIRQPRRVCRTMCG